MQLIKNEHIVAFDVDETLFMHDRMSVNFIENPYTKTKIYGNPNEKHIELLKQYKARELFVIVWSKAGNLWAETVVKTFQLDSYVDLIMTKLDRFVDDLQAHEVLGERVYIK